MSDQYAAIFNTTTGFPQLEHEFQSTDDATARRDICRLVEQMVGCKWFMSATLYKTNGSIYLGTFALIEPAAREIHVRGR